MCLLGAVRLICLAEWAESRRKHLGLEPGESVGNNPRDPDSSPAYDCHPRNRCSRATPKGRLSRLSPWARRKAEPVTAVMTVSEARLSKTGGCLRVPGCSYVYHLYALGVH